MKKLILKWLGLYPTGYEVPSYVNPKTYLIAKGIEIPHKKQVTFTRSVGESKSYNEVFGHLK